MGLGCSKHKSTVGPILKTQISTNIEKDPQKIYQITTQLLGKGGYGEVYKGINTLNKQFVAIKKIKRQNAESTVQNEISIQESCNHENIIKLYAQWQDEEFIYIVTELAEGGELFDHIIERDHYNEQDAVAIAKQILSAIFYLHKNNKIHGDIKPQNILLSKIPEGYSLQQQKFTPLVKISDFGLARILGEGKNQGGSPGFVAPEIIRKLDGYTTQPDIYSFGVLLYTMIAGELLFDGNNGIEMMMNQIKEKYKFNDIFLQTSPQCHEFVKKCITKDYTVRPTAEQLLNDPWFDIKSTVQIQNSAELKKLQNQLKLKAAMVLMQLGHHIENVIDSM